MGRGPVFLGVPLALSFPLQEYSWQPHLPVTYLAVASSCSAPLGVSPHLSHPCLIATLPRVVFRWKWHYLIILTQEGISFITWFLSPVACVANIPGSGQEDCWLALLQFCSWFCHVRPSYEAMLIFHIQGAAVWGMRVTKASSDVWGNQWILCIFYFSFFDFQLTHIWHILHLCNKTWLQ